MNIVAVTLNGIQHAFRIDVLPDTCPLCHRAIQPKLLSGQYLDGRRRLQITYRCASNACEETFVATYVPDVVGAFKLALTEPNRPQAASPRWRFLANQESDVSAQCAQGA
jgi:hypothetical protein